MKKRILSGVLCAALCAAPAALAGGPWPDTVFDGAETEAVTELGAVPETETVSETETVPETAEDGSGLLSETAETELMGAAADTAGSALIALLNAEDGLAEKLQSVDLEKLAEYMALIQSLLKSESFQSLMSYQEMRELVVLIIREWEKLAINDPELVGKVFVTLGVDEQVVRLIVDLFDQSGMPKEELTKWVESGEMTDTLNQLVELLSNPEVVSAIGSLKVPAAGTEAADEAAGETAEETVSEETEEET